jgi:hypothetical protein
MKRSKFAKKQITNVSVLEAMNDRDHSDIAS